jgi:hypothetical protein
MSVFAKTLHVTGFMLSHCTISRKIELKTIFLNDITNNRDPKGAILWQISLTIFARHVALDYAEMHDSATVAVHP